MPSAVLKLGVVLGVALALAGWPRDHAGAKPLKGAEVLSREAVTYGKWEVRMLAARGSGILSTFFLYKWNSHQPGERWEEVDIEVFGQEGAHRWQSTIITGVGALTYSKAVHASPVSMADAYHTFTLEWAPDRVVWSVNGREIRRAEGEQVRLLRSPQTFRFNLWVSSNEAWVGPFDPAVLPRHQFVDWIRYWAYTPGRGPGGTDFTLQWQDDFGTFDDRRWTKAAATFDENLADFVPANVTVRDGKLVLSLTREGAEGFTGKAPPDTEP
jgi:beta-glucanase (GH16 family)